MIPVVFSPIETALVDHLATALTGRGITAPVLNAIPRRDRPASYVLVLHPGGSLANIVTDRPRIVTEVVAGSGTAAAELAAVVRALINAAAPGYIGEVWIDRAIDAGFAYSPDPDTNAPRYLITTELWCRGAALT